jgi:hypothetical protein
MTLIPDESELTAAQESGVGADAAILSSIVPWESLASAGMLSDSEVQSIRRFDKRDRFTQAALWEKVRWRASLVTRLPRMPVWSKPAHRAHGTLHGAGSARVVAHD